jgi:hypothetical protein
VVVYWGSALRRVAGEPDRVHAWSRCAARGSGLAPRTPPATRSRKQKQSGTARSAP